MKRWTIAALAVLCIPFLSFPAEAAPALDGAAMSWPWALPFAGILASIATGPLLFPKIWHRHYGKITALWAILTLAPLAAAYGPSAAAAAFVHTTLAEYLSFIVLLFALYTVAGGILITGNLRGDPMTNTALLAFGTSIASVVGTTGSTTIGVFQFLRSPAPMPVVALEKFTPPFVDRWIAPYWYSA